MRKNPSSIPVNTFGDEFNSGISIERIAFESLPELGDWEQPERHDRHSFFLVEKGSVTIEIDFAPFVILAPSIVYMHPDQVHRIISFNNVTVCAWAADDANLKQDYLKLLENITPTAPLHLSQQNYELLSAAISLCMMVSVHKRNHLYHSFFQDSINTLVGLYISLFMEGFDTTSKLPRAEAITKAFREALAVHFIQIKRPGEYAEKLNLSIPYLNECVKNSTGYPVSHHIHQRVVLEAKRLLYHSNQSLKEISAALGYDDYPYFSRLFSKVTGMSPAAFRSKNLD